MDGKKNFHINHVGGFFSNESRKFGFSFFAMTCGNVIESSWESWGKQEFVSGEAFSCKKPIIVSIVKVFFILLITLLSLIIGGHTEH